MGDKKIPDALERDNNLYITDYKAQVNDYKKELENNKDPVIPAMLAGVGGVVYKKKGLFDVFSSPTVATNSVRCPAEDVIEELKENPAFMLDLQELSERVNNRLINSALKNPDIKLPVTVLEYKDVNPKDILTQCAENYQEAGENLKLPRKKPSSKQTASLYP